MSMVYLDGDFLEENEAKIPVFDRGFLLGDGAYATIQINEGTALFLQTHLEQLHKQCHSFHLAMPPITPELVQELIACNEAEKGIWRLKVIITGGDSQEARLPKRQGRVVMLLKPFTPDAFKPLILGIFPIPLSLCHASFKSLSHLNRYYVMEDAKMRGLDDCVSITEKGHLLEASFGNLVFVHANRMLTPDPALPLYFGVTLSQVLKLGKEAGFEVITIKMPLSELPQGCAAFRTNTMQGIRPIAQIGDMVFRRSTVLETLLVEGYKRLIEEQKKQRMGSMRCSV